MTDWLPLVVAVVGGIAVFIGHVYNQRANRRQQTARTLADAIAAVNDYQDLPFRVRRRPHASPEVRWDLAERISDLHARMDFFLAWLAIDAPEVATRYELLVQAVRREAGGYIKSAWEQPLIETDAGMNLGLGSQYQYGATVEARAACIVAMRAHLRIR